MGGRRPSLAEGLADDMVNDIVAGRYQANTPLPSETELAEQSGVSRLTVREAVKALAAKQVVRVEHGRGTFVNPSSSWSVLDPVLLIARSSQNADQLALPRKLIEARRVVEVAVAELAAERRTPEDLAELEESLMGLHESVNKLIKVIQDNAANLDRGDEVLNKLPILDFYNDDLLRNIQAMRQGP